jgi:hypothetical protein
MNTDSSGCVEARARFELLPRFPYRHSPEHDRIAQIFDRFERSYPCREHAPIKVDSVLTNRCGDANFPPLHRSIANY